MSTLKNKELKQLDTAIKNAQGVRIDKDDVLKIVVEELKKRDKENKFIVDTHAVSSLKDIYNKLTKLY